MLPPLSGLSYGGITHVAIHYYPIYKSRNTNRKIKNSPHGNDDEDERQHPTLPRGDLFLGTAGWSAAAQRKGTKNATTNLMTRRRGKDEAKIWPEPKILKTKMRKPRP